MYWIASREYGDVLGHGVSRVVVEGKDWTTEPPTVEGLYKAKTKGGSTVWVLLVSVKFGYCECFYDSTMYDISNFTRWLGPIPEPEPPTE